MRNLTDSDLIRLQELLRSAAEEIRRKTKCSEERAYERAVRLLEWPGPSIQRPLTSSDAGHPDNVIL